MPDLRAKDPAPAAMPLQIALMGPPGGGKTCSALRLAEGCRRVLGGPICLIDTEKRSRGYHARFGGHFDFLIADLDPPFTPSRFLEIIKAQLPMGPSAIIIDSASDEHEGPGGVLEWHDSEVSRMGGNEWAAWAKPKADRKKMLGALRQITVPMIFCFRARERTEQREKPGGNGRKEVVNVGWAPVAPLEFVHNMDLTALLPSNAEGTPVWRMGRADRHQGDENSPTLKMVPAYLKDKIKAGQLDQDFGEALARWASGMAAPAPAPTASSQPVSPDFAARIEAEIYAATDPDALGSSMNAHAATSEWKALKATDPKAVRGLRDAAINKIAALKSEKP